MDFLGENEKNLLSLFTQKFLNEISLSIFAVNGVEIIGTANTELLLVDEQLI